MSTNDISRRNFVKGAAAVGTAAGAAVFAGSASAQSAAPDNIAWGKEADVVVIGFGGAGAASAISAHDAGAEVLVLEKSGVGGGNTAVSGGGVLCPTNSEDAYKYIMGLFDISHSRLLQHN